MLSPSLWRDRPALFMGGREGVGREGTRLGGMISDPGRSFLLQISPIWSGTLLNSDMVTKEILKRAETTPLIIIQWSLILDYCEWDSNSRNQGLNERKMKEGHTVFSWGTRGTGPCLIMVPYAVKSVCLHSVKSDAPGTTRGPVQTLSLEEWTILPTPPSLPFLQRLHFCGLNTNVIWDLQIYTQSIFIQRRINIARLTWVIFIGHFKGFTANVELIREILGKSIVMSWICSPQIHMLKS